MKSAMGIQGAIVSIIIIICIVGTSCDSVTDLQPEVTPPSTLLWEGLTEQYLAALQADTADGDIGPVTPKTKGTRHRQCWETDDQIVWRKVSEDIEIPEEDEKDKRIKTYSIIIFVLVMIVIAMTVCFCGFLAKRNEGWKEESDVYPIKHVKYGNYQKKDSIDAVNPGADFIQLRRRPSQVEETIVKVEAAEKGEADKEDEGEVDWEAYSSRFKHKILKLIGELSKGNS
ncbi:uncharacterized protein [Hyperolius riggenbachi]|uniref:uncharacterized protein n=1 Tax=Hyperolius riggenbachi TaxID=752182 RepID=UPI0035A3CB7F